MPGVCFYFKIGIMTGRLVWSHFFFLQNQNKVRIFIISTKIGANQLVQLAMTEISKDGSPLVIIIITWMLVDKDKLRI